jgi:hypothetical protein
MPDNPTPKEHAEGHDLEAALDALERSEPVHAPEAAEAVAAALQQELDDE